MPQSGSGSTGWHLRAVDPPTGSDQLKPKPSVEAIIRRVAVGAACAVLALYTAVTGNWVALLDALCAAAVVALVLVPTFWLLNNPKPGARLRAVPKKR